MYKSTVCISLSALFVLFFLTIPSLQPSFAQSQQPGQAKTTIAKSKDPNKVCQMQIPTKFGDYGWPLVRQRPMTDKEYELCLSLSNTQSGFPGQTCDMPRDPISKSVDSISEIIRFSISNQLDPNSAVGRALSPALSTLFGPSALKVQMSGVMFDLPEAAFSAANTDIHVRSGYTLQYYAGCWVGNTCAMTHEFPDDPDLAGIEVDNLCVPNYLWGGYLNLKKKIRDGVVIVKENDSLLGIAATATQFAPQPTPPSNNQKALGHVAKNTFTNEMSLARLCFRSSPSGDMILNSAITQKYAGSLPWTTSWVVKVQQSSFYSLLFAPTTFFTSHEVDFLKDPDAPLFMRKNEESISNAISEYWTSRSSLPFIQYPYYRTLDTEVHDLSICLDSAQKGLMYTAIGALPVNNLASFISDTVYGIMFGIAGAITLGCIIYCSIRLQLSQGGEDVSKVKEVLVQCLTGLALIIFSIFMLRFIGYSVLRLPGLG